ncbi:aldo/keto reductase [Prochlorococcus marinus str. MU1404]|uniref:aldo/keto reductase n=1 Tax=Prochlorococcus marinus TaxID=1219 RepID=UPI001ADC6E8C|nr:aldo/keto reductase [Prochlorococcus marinus]MBO8230774.1 aldo/keto reductase [Prochlorococcus marinus XMU1404]MBW3073808.1 aldo/keto reductase [Prochlorococcus marinus str. MU1404]MCR8544894.1 aldo/keto reductase [Prochlorococcus marinus CUG1432]
MQYRRFGRTNLNIPILSLGGMRFQKSWDQLDFSEISYEEQNKVENILNLANKYGLSHVETAKYYGTSEVQLGMGFQNTKKIPNIIQTKIPPNSDPKIFEREVMTSIDKLRVKRIDLLAIHGINTAEHLHQTVKDGGCIDILRSLQKKKLLGSIGFSTHGKSSLIEKAISTNLFDYVNLHWYFINQENTKVINLANKYDLGVFIISPTDKGGHLHTPSNKMLELCSPLHPIVFNDLFCLRNKNVHTLSVGIAKEADFDLHLEAVSLLSESDKYIPKIINKLKQESVNSLGLDWYHNWNRNLPSWEYTPGNINIPVLLWLSNLVEWLDLEGFAKARYQLLGNGSHWFPGCNANLLDVDVSEDQLLKVLEAHINPKKVINKLRILKEKFGDRVAKRLSEK